MDSVYSLSSVAVWPSCTISMQFPVRLYVIPEILMFALANTSVLFMLFVICVLSFWSSVRGGDLNTNVSWLGWCYARGFWVLG
jgi:hypothetical protein